MDLMARSEGDVVENAQKKPWIKPVLKKRPLSSEMLDRVNRVNNGNRDTKSRDVDGL